MPLFDSLVYQPIPEGILEKLESVEGRPEMALQRVAVEFLRDVPDDVALVEVLIEPDAIGQISIWNQERFLRNE
jgi:hypothetical protein